MPQFDSVTFLPQIFWLTLVFFAFYMVVIRYYLPGLTRIVKIRKKRLEAAQKTGDEFAVETVSATSTYEDLLVKGADSSRNVTGNTVQSGSDWIETSVDSLDHNEIPELNAKYAQANGTIKSKHFIIQQLIKG
jgi:hypothetical protein